MRSEICERAESQAKSHHHRGDQLPRLDAVEEPAHEWRADRHRNGRKAESTRDLFVVPSKFVLKRLHHEAETVDEYCREARENPNVTDRGHAPARIAEMVLSRAQSGAFRPASQIHGEAEPPSRGSLDEHPDYPGLRSQRASIARWEFISIFRM